MGPDAPIVRPELMRWKYFEPRPDWDGPRSYVMLRDGHIFAHGCVVPETFRTAHGRVTSLQDHITWTGILPDPLKLGVFAAADVVCQVSRWEEGFGYVIAEAMASGKSLVGTRVGAIPELVRDGISGYLVERRDPPALAARILDLLRDSDLRRRMGQAGREFALRNFNADTNIAEFLKLYGI